MLDKRSEFLLKIINNICAEDSYKIIDIPLFIERMEKRYNIDEVSLKQMMVFLQKRELIDVKYSDNEVYCLCILPKGRLYFENTVTEDKQVKKLKKMFAFYVLLSGIFAFLGAALAILLLL
jgi:hypothetical protein